MQPLSCNWGKCDYKKRGEFVGRPLFCFPFLRIRTATKDHCTNRSGKQCPFQPPKCTSRSPKKRDLPRIQTTEEETEEGEKFSLSTEDIQVNEGLYFPYKLYNSILEDCGAPWLIILCISNAVTLFFAFIACAYFQRRQPPPKTPRHFKF